MIKSLQQYIETGQPVLVRTEEGLLIPYLLKEKDLRGESSGINHRTRDLFYSCLERIPGESFDPKDFIKIINNFIFHLGITQHYQDLSDSIGDENKYLFHSGRIHKELDYEEGKGPFIKKWEDMSQYERDEEMNRHSIEKIDLAWRNLNNIRTAAQSDAIAARQKRYGLESKRPTLYEVIFSSETNLGVDIYLKNDK